MKFLYLTIALLLITSITSYPKEPIKGVEVFLEKMPDNDPYANMELDEKGAFKFAKLGFGEYTLKLLIREDREYQKEVKNSKKKQVRLDNSKHGFYNIVKQEMYMATRGGCFKVKFSGLKNIDEERIKFEFENEVLGANELVTVGNFSISVKRGKFKGVLKPISLSKYLKLHRKYI